MTTEIEQDVWGLTAEGEAIVRYRMRNACGAEVELTNLGAAVTAVRVPDREGRIADVAIGYADGYPRCMWQQGEAIVKGKVVPIVGRVCMDQLMVDITEVPGVEAGDWVTLVGREGDREITWDQLAAQSGSVSYERICGIRSRVPRVYLDKK